MSAYEAITTRQALAAGEAVSQYDAVMIADDATLMKADGTRPFVGICEYGTDTVGDMITVVRGIFPGITSADASKGALLMLDATAAGKFVTATTGKIAVATLLEDVVAGNLAAIMILDNPVTVA